MMALEHVRLNKNRYVLVISDLRMPNLNGLKLIKAIKEANPSVRTILMTAFTLENDELFTKYVKEEIINAFLQKPIRLDVLRKEVDNQLHTYELRKNSRVN